MIKLKTLVKTMVTRVRSGKTMDLKGYLRKRISFALCINIAHLK